MGDLGVDVPPRLLAYLINMVFWIVFLLDWLWGGYLYVIRGLAMAAQGARGTWAASLRGLLDEPVISRGCAGETVAGGTTSRVISATGPLAGALGNATTMSRVEHVWEALPGGVGIVAVDGMRLKASSVRALAVEAEFVDFVVIVGPSSVVTSYQIGLVAQQAFSVVEDLTPESATVHPLIPQSWGNESFLRQLLRVFTSLVALAAAIYASVSGCNITIVGFNVFAIAALLLNVLSRILLRPKRAKIASDDSPPTMLPAGAAAVAEAPAAEISTQSAGNGEGAGNGDPGDERGTWDRFKRASVELTLHVLASASYGLSGWSGIAPWMSWALLAVGAGSNTVFSTSGATYFPLTAWMSGLIAPLFASTWVVYFAAAVALSPVTSLVALCVLFALSVEKSSPPLAFLATIMMAWIMLAITLSISALAGEHLTPDWVLHLSLVGWVLPVLVNLGLEVLFLGILDLNGAVDEVKDWAHSSGRMGLPSEWELGVYGDGFGDGFGYFAETGLHVRFVPSYLAGTPASVSVNVGRDQPEPPGWHWKG